jgi:hypothetical protein
MIHIKKLSYLFCFLNLNTATRTHRKPETRSQRDIKVIKKNKKQESKINGKKFTKYTIEKLVTVIEYLDEFYKDLIKRREKTLKNKKFNEELNNKVTKFQKNMEKDKILQEKQKLARAKQQEKERQEKERQERKIKEMEEQKLKKLDDKVKTIHNNTKVLAKAIKKNENKKKKNNKIMFSILLALGAGVAMYLSGVATLAGACFYVIYLGLVYKAIKIFKKSGGNKIISPLIIGASSTILYFFGPQTSDFKQFFDEEDRENYHEFVPFQKSIVDTFNGK